MSASVRKQASISSQALPHKHDFCHNQRKRLHKEAHGPFYEKDSRLPEKRSSLTRPFELDQQVNASIGPPCALDFKKVPVHNQIDAAEPVQGLILNYSPKGDVSSPSSPLEREANEVATCVTGGQRPSTIHEAPVGLHSKEAGFVWPKNIPKDGGMPLPAPERSFFEARFGRSFADVSIHIDRPAEISAQMLHADAFALRHEIYFGAGKYAPQTTEGRRLIAHELAHTLQQQNNGQTIMRQEMQPETGAAPGPYDGCPDPQSLAKVRAQAAATVKQAIALLDDRNIQSAVPLLAAHFHLDPTRTESRGDLGLIRAQFARMGSALDSGIRIFCRSAPRFSPEAPPASMPTDDRCKKANAYSTSCAAGNPTATVILCEMALQGMTGSPLEKTLIHEFAHVACNGSPPIEPAGAEKYYEGALLPGNKANEITCADSYAWFALNAKNVRLEPAPKSPADRGSRRSRAPWWAALGVGAALTLGGLFAPGLLIGGALGLGIGGAGLLGLFD